MASIIWDLESEERKETLSEYFREAVGLTKSDSLEDYQRKMDDFLKTDDLELTKRERALRNYFKGELHKEQLIKESFDLNKEDIKEEAINEIIESEKTRFRKFKDKSYSVLYEEENEKRIYGFQKGNKVSCRIERQLIHGKEVVRLRDSRGRFASGVLK